MFPPCLPPPRRCGSSPSSARGKRPRGGKGRRGGNVVRERRRAPPREGRRAAPEVAGRALFQRAEIRYRAYLPLRIVPPLEPSFTGKQRALARCADLYAEAIRVGDAGTVSASFHRLGEGLENFRAAILASPLRRISPPRRRRSTCFSSKNAPHRSRNAPWRAYRNNLRQAVAGDHFDPFVAKSRERLRALRPALFPSEKPEFAFPVVPRARPSESPKGRPREAPDPPS